MGGLVGRPGFGRNWRNHRRKADERVHRLSHRFGPPAGQVLARGELRLLKHAGHGLGGLGDVAEFLPILFRLQPCQYRRIGVVLLVHVSQRRCQTGAHRSEERGAAALLGHDREPTRRGSKQN